MPEFGYGCAVFLQGDIVNFQRQGWRAEEILAALAAVLPKNVFLYVAGVPNLPAYGTRFVLQGGTQKNLAVVKAEVDFLRSCFRGSAKDPEIMVHEHCGESGAIGAALESARMSNTNMMFNDQRARDELGHCPRPAIEALIDSARWFVENGYVSAKRAARIKFPT